MFSKVFFCTQHDCCSAGNINLNIVRSVFPLLLYNREENLLIGRFQSVVSSEFACITIQQNYMFAFPLSSNSVVLIAL